MSLYRDREAESKALRKTIAEGFHRSIFATMDEAIAATAVAFSVSKLAWHVTVEAGDMFESFFVREDGHAVYADGRPWKIDDFLHRVWARA